MMRHRLSVRSLVAAGLLAAALGPSPALADDNFFGRTVGTATFTDDEPPVLTGVIEQFFIIFKGPAVFQSLVMDFEITLSDGGPGSVVGGIHFIGMDPADTLAATYSGINIINDDGIWTGAGEWTATGGTGAFAGLSGSGTYTTALLLPTDSASTAFNGTIVPAPAAGTLLLGPLALMARRRRAPAS